MTREEQEAQVRLGQLQAAIGKFNKERLKTEEYARGLKPARVPREQVVATIQALRDHRAEEEAARQLADLQRLMLGREPTASEAASGVPSVPAQGLGNPLVIAGIAAGAWVLVSIFNYLAEHEQRIQRELNPSAVTSSDVLGNLQQWIVPGLVIGGLVVGGWYLVKKPGQTIGSVLGFGKKSKLPRTTLSQMRTTPMPGRGARAAYELNPDEGEDDEDLEDEDEDELEPELENSEPEVDNEDEDEDEESDAPSSDEEGDE